MASGGDPHVSEALGCCLLAVSEHCCLLSGWRSEVKWLGAGDGMFHVADSLLTRCPRGQVLL